MRSNQTLCTERSRIAHGAAVAAIAAFLIAERPEAAFGQPAPVCSNQSQVDGCLALRCGSCEQFPSPIGACSGPKSDCDLACFNPYVACLAGCSTVECSSACEGVFNTCQAPCDSTCNTCVAQCRGPCDSLCVVCDAGGPYSIECDTDGAPEIQLDGSGSEDPQDDGLTYKWTTDCPGATFDDDSIVDPVLTLATPLNCLECSVTLEVTEPEGGTATCSAMVNVTDDERPTVGTPAQLTECYTSSSAARAAACAALLAVADDNCDTDLFCNTFTIGEPAECADVIYAFVQDDCDNTLEASVPFQASIDEGLPTATCSALQTEYEVDENCEAIVKFKGQITDNCCVSNPRSFPVEVKVRDDNATVGPTGMGLTCTTNLSDDEKTLDIECAFKVSDLTGCPAVVEWSFSGTDCCGNELAERCVATATVVDKIEPKITCPPPITLHRGDKICNDDVKNWLESATATDNCDPEPTITTDAPECGFPYGSTTEVTFAVTDDCGNTDTCTSEITIEATPRVSGTQKGSLLVFSDIEIRWDADGALTQDTFLDVANDSDEGSVYVQAWYINGDAQVEEIVNHAGEVIQGFEPGWNTADCRFELTKRQPHFWSAARGSAKCQPFVVLDEDGPGRPDARAVTAAGPRVLRGYVVMVAVASPSTMVAGDHPNAWQEIRWNHLKGDALVINYTNGGGYEYNAWAYQARCGETGEPLLDCQTVDVNGTCCTAEIVPGRLDMDGFQYDINFDELLLDFYASGSTTLSSVDTTVMVDTALTLHTVDVDLRQDGDGPLLTKAEFEIFNEFESKFSGTRRCICCWDQTLLSDYVRSEAVPNHFLRTQLRTDKGSARINGVHSTDCDYFETCGIWPRVTDSAGGSVAGIGNGPNFSHDTALLGVAVKELTFSGAKTNFETAAMNLVGTDEQASRIWFDVDESTGELRTAPAPSAPSAPATPPTPTRSRGSDGKLRPARIGTGR